jgi:thioredoxin 2
MSDAAVHAVCPHCDGVNGVPAGRPAKEAKCGRCKAPLFAGAPFPLTAANFDPHTGRNDIPVLASTVPGFGYSASGSGTRRNTENIRR